jgi:hypothetical protein
LRKIFFAAALLGTLLPYYFLFQFFSLYGFNLHLLARQAFSSPTPAFLGFDVIVSSLVLWAYIFSKGRRLGMRYLWIYVLLNLLIGVSLALPAFLWAHEGKLASKPAA